MTFELNDDVTYKIHKGKVSFISKQYISILLRKGEHKSQDVKIVVYQSDFKNVKVVK